TYRVVVVPPVCVTNYLSILRLSFYFLLRPPPISTLFPYTTLFRSAGLQGQGVQLALGLRDLARRGRHAAHAGSKLLHHPDREQRSEEHTSELQSRENLVCRLLLEKKKKKKRYKIRIKISILYVCKR